ncbi:MAG: acylphosphatase [archaeon]
MKKAIRLYLTGTVQSIFFRLFIKQNVEKFNVKGFFRKLDDGRAEVFLEGEGADIESAIEVCKKGPKYAQIRNVEMKTEHVQGYKDFRIINF